MYLVEFSVSQIHISEACIIGVLGIQDICHFSFQGYKILSILLPGIWDTVSNILITFRDIEHLGKLIMEIIATCLFTSRDVGYLVPRFTSLIYT